jgi:hypothetical protein
MTYLVPSSLPLWGMRPFPNLSGRIRGPTVPGVQDPDMNAIMLSFKV